MKLFSFFISLILLSTAFGQRQIILSSKSSDWQVLHSLNNEGVGVDPALDDSDFNSTWMTLGMTDSLYDGPSFTPNQTAPFRVVDADSGDGGTFLANPGADRNGAIYFVREITGPLLGATSLEFDITSLRPYRLYLNGELIIDTLGVPQSGSAWDLYWENQSRQYFEKHPFLLPGKNTLAISLHPFNPGTANLQFDLSLTGVPGTSQMVPLNAPTPGPVSTIIKWFTATPSASTLRYGTTRNSLTNTISLPASTQLHEVPIPNPSAGQRLYYEILKSDGSSYNPPSINSYLIPKNSLISFKSNWAHLIPRDSDTNTSIDPATFDPDFYQTWSTQPHGSFPGNGIYDGPAFVTSSAPFGPESSIATTIIEQPAAAWFIKEVDGGTSGYHQLELTSHSDAAITVFLNGNKIAETYNAIASQSIWAQYKNYFNTRKISLSSNLTIPPGPNLIAVQMHLSHPVDRDVFDLSLVGTPLTESVTVPFPVKTTSSSVDLTWATDTPQSTRLRWGTSPSSLTESTNLPGSLTNHALTLSDLSPSTVYFHEVLDPSGSSFTPPVLGSFKTRDPILLSRQSSGWSVLENIPEGAFADPALADPDFLTTWFNPAAYDGPAFTPNQSSPFVSAGRHLRVGQTVLQTIDDKTRPIWLLKEIDGGATGYQSLTFEGIISGGIVVHLNGQPLLNLAMTQNANPGSWDHLADSNSSQSGNFSYQLPSHVTLQPGPNLLAISLHPYSFETNSNFTAEFEVRGVPPKLTIANPSLVGLNFTNVILSWSTNNPASSLVRLGLEPLSLATVSEDPEFKTNHQISFPEFVEGGTYYYEILAVDSLGNTGTFLGSFTIQPQLMRKPFLQKASPTSMTVKWRTRDPGPTFLRFGQDPNNLDQVLSGTNEPAPLNFFNPNFQNKITDHTVTITGLSPDTQYYYQIAPNNSPAPSSDLKQFFTTPPLQGTRKQTRIWVIGDSGAPGQDVLSVKDAYLQYTSNTPTDVWLMLGDNAYNSGTDSEHQRALFDIFPELLKNTPVWPTVGNHEGYSNEYYGVFDLPTQGESGGIPSGTEKYYSFDYGNIHFICLNSEEDPAGMMEWLETDLQSTRSDWIIAFFHQGPYTRGSHDSDFESEHFASREKYLPLLESYGVDLVLSGHSHQYERSVLLNGHYQDSSTFSLETHVLDSGTGSPHGTTSRDTGFFQYSTPESSDSPYQKTIATPNSGQVSTTVGASSILGYWSGTTSGQKITHPNPHPVHISTIRALGSMVIDVDGLSLSASYLDNNGQIRDHFQIEKSPEESPAITWWKDNFGAHSYPYFIDWFSDSDSDTHHNLQEFVHGTNPHTADQIIEASITLAPHEGQPAQWFSIQYDLREGATAIVEVSQDLTTFTQSNIETQRLTDPDANGIARWESRVLRTDQRTLFFRLKTSR